jgi:glycosyltransferase involved in cell wall biosynthesis/SAM-dependent methyltransferase
MQIVALSWRDLANPAAGGAEVVVDHLLRGFADRGHDVALICGGPVGDRPYTVIEAGGTYSQYFWAPFRCATRYRNADLVIDCENGVPFFSPIWRRGPSICLVHHVHTDQWGMHFPALLAAIYSAIERYAMPAIYKNRTFVSISPSTAQALEAIGVEPRHIYIISPGVDIISTHTTPKTTDPQYLSLCRLVPHKQVGVLLRAWLIASESIPGRFVIAGDGPELEQVRALASTVPRVDVLGRVSDQAKQQLLGESWVFLSAAHHEGWGLSVSEAAAAGTPALAVDATGIRDAIVDGVTGVLVPNGGDDVVKDLATAWVALASDQARLRKMGSAALERAQDLSWDRTVDAWLKTAEEVTRTQGSRWRSRRIGRRSAQWRRDQKNAIQRETTAMPPAPEALSFTNDLRRSVTLLRGFRTQYERPDDFYTLLADDTVSLVERYESVSGKRVIDVGGGPGYFAQAFRRAGARSCFVEPFWESLTETGQKLGYGIIGNGLTLPICDGSFDISHSSNVLEHVLDPRKFFNEMLRVLRPGGLMFLAFTNWFSPFGGHETSPWHYLGGERAVTRYEAKHGHAPKNRYGSSLFRLDISEVTQWARKSSTGELIDAFPRYYPSWTKPIVRVPGVREVVTWNLVLVLRRRDEE